MLSAVLWVPAASAAQPTVGLGTATPYAVLAGSTVTNTGPSVISGDVGVDPGTATTGFPPGTVINGTQYAADAQALQAQTDLTTAYNDAAGRTPVTVESADLGGQTLDAGVYQAASALSLTGTVTLDAQGNPNAVFIFQAGSTLITASSSTVLLINGASACNVFWQVGSSATLGGATTFVGTILALTSVSLVTGATVMGQVLARNGAVTLDTNTITNPGCSAVTPTAAATTTPTTPTATTSPTSGAGGSSTGGGSGGATSTGSTGSTGTGSGSGGSIGSTGSANAVATVIPVGAPSTGAGGAAHSRSDGLLLVGSLLFVGSGLALAAAWRRRRSPVETASSDQDLN